jgi:hypothetical protein
MTKATMLAPTLLVALLAGPSLAQEAELPPDLEERIEQERDFMKMAVPADEPEACEFTDPPEDLARTAYLRNGYYWTRVILAMERWEETQSCECFYDDFSWDDALTAAEQYVTSSNPVAPFRVYDIQTKAEEMVRRHAEACGG